MFVSCVCNTMIHNNCKCILSRTGSNCKAWDKKDRPAVPLYQEPATQAKIDSSRAGETIRHIISDKRKRRALCKVMRDSFQWVDETVNLFNDFGDSFYFTTESGFPSNGGLVLFENTCDGHKGLCYQVCT